MGFQASDTIKLIFATNNVTMSLVSLGQKGGDAEGCPHGGGDQSECGLGFLFFQAFGQVVQSPLDGLQLMVQEAIELA